MITCQQLDGFLLAYVDGTLPTPARSEFERHLQVCPQCVDYLETYRATIALGRAAFADPGAAPDSVPEELVRAILEARDR